MLLGEIEKIINIFQLLGFCTVIISSNKPTRTQVHI